MTFSERAARRVVPLQPMARWSRLRSVGMGGVGAPAETGPGPRRSPRPDAASLRRLYVEEGMTVAALAARLGVVTQTAHNWLVAAGVPRRVSPASARADLSDVGSHARTQELG